MSLSTVLGAINLRVLLLALGFMLFLFAAKADTQLNSYTTDVQSDPAVARLTDGNFVVAWDSRNQAGANSGKDIYCRIVDPTGAPLSGNEVLVNNFTGSNGEDQDTPRVTALPNDGFAVVWESTPDITSSPNLQEDVFGRIGHFTGTTIQFDTTSFQLDASSTIFDTFPDVAVLPDGNIIATWGQDNGAPNFDTDHVIVRTFNGATGAALSGETVVSGPITTASQDRPKIAVNGSSVAVVWESAGRDGNGSAVAGSTLTVSNLDATIGVARAATTLNSTTGGDQRDPAVTFLSTENILVAYDSPGGSGSDIVGRLFDSSLQNPGSEFLINQVQPGDQNVPEVAALPGTGTAGPFVAAWATPTSVAGRIFNTGASPGAAPIPLSNEARLPTTAGSQSAVAVAAQSTTGFFAAWTSDSNGDFDIESRNSVAPAFTSGNIKIFKVGTAGSFTVNTSGLPAAIITDGGATLPGNITFADNGDGTATLAGTPAAGTGGSYSFTFTASNGVGASATQDFTLIIDQPPAITSANATTFTAGTAGTFTVTTTGFPKPTLSDGGATLPSGVTFTDNGNGTATLAGTPAAGTGGTYTFAVAAGNNIVPNATQTFTLTVDEAPSITSGNHTTFTTGTLGTFTVTATGFPKPTLSDGGATLPGGVTFTDHGNGTATLTGTPAAGTGGTYPFTITAHNSTSPDATQSFTLTVNQPPAISSANATTFTVGTPGSFTVTTSGFPKPTLSDGGTTLPGGVTFTDKGDGTATLAGTPAAGTGGTYPFTLTAHNSTSPDATQSFTLTVDEAPAITSANATTFTEGTAGTFTVTTTGFPKPTLSDGGATLPGGVTFIDNGNGTATLAGTPAAGTGGTYPFTITAHNSTSPDATQSFTLTVNQPPAISSANATTFTVGTPGSFTVTTTGFPKPTLSDGGTTLPGGVTFHDNGDGTATLAGTPAAGSGGAYPFTITASNGVNPDATQSFTLTVDEAPSITSASSATFTVGTPGTFTITTSGFPKPTLSDGGATLPSGVTFTDNGNGTATLAGTPAAGTGGTYPFTITAHNTSGADATQNFTLIVNQPPAITSANVISFTEGTAGTFTISTTGYPKPTLSDGGAALPIGVTFVDNGNGAATLAGTPAVDTDGVYPFTITASNGVGTAATQSFTLTVTDPAVVVTGGFSFTSVEAVASTSQTVATFTDPGGAEAASDYTATIDWGDQTLTSTGTITVDGTTPGQFDVAGSHTYAEEGPYTISITVTDGSSASTPVTSTATVSESTVLATTPADFNGDGFADLVLQNNQQVAFWYANGANIIGSDYALSDGNPFTIPSDFRVVATGDFNGDGHPDVVLENTTTAEVVFWFTNGPNIIGTAYATTAGARFYVPSGWTIVGAGDFDGDGKPDLVMENQQIGQVGILYCNGTDITGGAYVMYKGQSDVLPTNFHIAGVGDFNDDGKPDLVVVDPTNGLLGFWLMNNSALTTGVYARDAGGNTVFLPSGWTIGAVGDYNNDGSPDLALQNTDGSLAMWFFNGTTLSSGSIVHGGGGPAMAPPGWQVVGPR